MANKYGIPIEVEQRLRARDSSCVYCKTQFSTKDRKSWSTIEHLSEKPPFRWGEGLTEDGLAICCWSCNSSRGQKTLNDWFCTRYCLERLIGADTVAAPVQRYLRSNQATPGNDVSAESPIVVEAPTRSTGAR